MEVAGDLTPLLGPSLVRLDAMAVKQLQWVVAVIFHDSFIISAWSDKILAKGDHHIALGWVG